MNDVIVTEKKPWYKSRTLWFNALVAVLAALELSANLIQPYVPGNIYGYGMVVLTVGNAFLRFLTSQGIGK
jgi:hypothetical protein